MYCLCSLPHAAGGLLCGWGSRGSWNVTCLVVLLKPPGVEGLGRVTIPMCNWATRLGTLNSKIPGCSDVPYEIKICGLITPLNT